MSSSRTANSTRHAGFTPIDTINGPRASPRNLTYSRRALTLGPSHGRSTNNSLFQEFHAPSSSPAEEGRSSSKRSLVSPSIPAKRVKTNETTPKAVQQSSPSIRMSGSEDELQIVDERESKPRRSNRKASFGGIIDSYRDIERRMNFSSRASRARSEPETKLIAVEIDKDELQDSPEVDERSYPHKSVATSTAIPETFLSDAEDEIVSNTRSSTLPLAGPRVGPSTAKSSSTRQELSKRTTQHGRSARVQCDGTDDSQPTAAQDEVLVPDSQPAAVHDNTDSASKRPKKPNPSDMSLVDQTMEQERPKLEQGEAAGTDDSESDMDFNNPEPPRNSNPQGETGLSSSEIMIHELYWNGIHLGSVLILSVESAGIEIRKPGKDRTASSEAHPRSIPFESMTNVYAGTERHMVFRVQKDRAQKDGPKDVFQFLILSTTDLEKFSIKVINKVRRFFNGLEIVENGILSDQKPKKEEAAIITSKSKQKSLPIPMYHHRCDENILEEAYKNCKNARVRDSCLRKLDPCKPSKQPRQDDKKEDVVIPDRWEFRPFTKLYYVDQNQWTRSLHYPYTDAHQKADASKATVDFDEVSYLNSDEWLNDSLIWFGLKHLFETYPESKTNVYCFNTYFYPTLTKTAGKSVSKDGQRSLINYDAVRRWTSRSGVDIFKYRHVIVPINFDAHWFVAIMANVNNISLQTDDDSAPDVSIAADGQNEEPTSSGHVDLSMVHRRSDSSDQREIETKCSQLSIEPNETKSKAKKKIVSEADSAAAKLDMTRPAIITLDSMGSKQAIVVRNLKSYLKEEARARHKATIAPPSGITAKGIPQQDNGCDCGLFLIEYVKRFLQDPDAFVGKVLSKQMSLEYWPDTFANELRDDFRELVLKEGYMQNFPDIASDLERENDRKIAAEKEKAEAASQKVETTQKAKTAPNNQRHQIIGKPQKAETSKAETPNNAEKLQNARTAQKAGNPQQAEKHPRVENSQNFERRPKTETSEKAKKLQNVETLQKGETPQRAEKRPKVEYPPKGEKPLKVEKLPPKAEAPEKTQNSRSTETPQKIQKPQKVEALQNIETPQEVNDEFMLIESPVSSFSETPKRHRARDHTIALSDAKHSRTSNEYIRTEPLKRSRRNNEPSAAERPRPQTRGKRL